VLLGIFYAKINPFPTQNLLYLHPLHWKKAAMDLHQKIRTLPTRPGVYLYKNADGEVIYVGKAKNLRSRVRSYLLEASQSNAKTGSLMRDAVDVDYILVDNEHEALALENNLIKQRKPRFNILLRDDKTYPYVKLTLGDRWPKVFVTRRLRRDGSVYYGPYFPGNLAYRVVDLIHRSFLLPSCKLDLSRYHPRPCLQYYIGRCLGPCVENLTTKEIYAEAVRDAQMFLEGRTSDLNKSLHERMAAAATAEQFELAAKYRDLLVTIDQLSEKQRIASVEDDDADVFGYHCENGMIAVNLFHLRGGKIVDRREFFWEDLAEVITDPDESFDDSSEENALHGVASTSKVLHQGATSVLPKRPQNEEGALAPEESAARAPSLSSIPGDGVGAASGSAQRNGGKSPGLQAGETAIPQEAALAPASPGFNPGAFFSALLKQLYIDQPYVPTTIYVPVDFSDKNTLASLLAEHTKHRVEIAVPQRGEKRSLVDLAAQNAKQSYDQRFRVLAPSRKAIQEALQDALTLEDLPRTIECFDISHIQGAETVASMVVWEDGEMKKSAYRKFKIKSVEGVDDFASMREVITRRYKRVLEEKSGAPDLPGVGRSGNSGSRSLPSLILIDGGVGQLHAAAAALESLGITTQPLASIAKREEVIYLYGQEDEPVVLDRRSPVLHLIQRIRDESHRFAITYHRKRREMRDRDSELLAIPGVGARTRQRLLEHFGSLRSISTASLDSLSAVVPPKTAEEIHNHFHATEAPPNPLPVLP
jgi:excinuclease ABC subunit C